MQTMRFDPRAYYKKKTLFIMLTLNQFKRIVTIKTTTHDYSALVRTTYAM